LLLTVSFQGQGGGTKWTLRHTGIPDADRDHIHIGWSESPDKLAGPLKPSGGTA